jgi:arylsulfatase
MKRILLLFAPLLLVSPSLEAADQRPSILLIMADDMGYSDIGCYGSEIDTPHIDRLAATGVRFTQFYNGARCCPTRASLLTGLYAHQTGIGNMVTDQGLPAYRGDLNENCVTIAQVLQASGYSTFLSGKWHLTKHTDQFRSWLKAEERRYTSKHNWPLQRGFDQFFGTIHGAGSFFEPSTLVQGNEPIEGCPEGFYYTDAISDYAVEKISLYSAESSQRPFFGYVAYTAPHWPLHAKTEDIERYKHDYAVGWDVIRTRRLSRMRLLGLLDQSLPLSTRHDGVPEWEAEPDQDYYAHCMAVYAAQVYSMDQGIGRIIDQLEESGEFENTLILFLSDNGGCAEILSEVWPRSLHVPYEMSDGSPVFRGKHPDRLPGPANTYASYGVGWANASNTPFTYFKHYIQEGGISTPLVVSWPKGIPRAMKGRTTAQVGHIKDIMPTILEVAGAAYPERFQGNRVTPTEGFSLVRSLAGKEVSVPPLFWEHHGNRGMRSGDWKLVGIKNGPWELYNLAQDRIESRDLASQYPDRVSAMAAEYRGWADRVGVVENPQNAN